MNNLSNLDIMLQATTNKPAAEKSSKKKEAAKEVLENCDKLPWYETGPNFLFGWTGWKPFDCKDVAKKAEDAKAKSDKKKLQLERISLVLKHILLLQKKNKDLPKNHAKQTNNAKASAKGKANQADGPLKPCSELSWWQRWVDGGEKFTGIPMSWPCKEQLELLKAQKILRDAAQVLAE